MLNLIYGPPASGKTYFSDTQVLKALDEGKNVILLVPEQEAIDAENRIYDRALLSQTATERLTVVSFRRLANHAFRKHGGIRYENIGDGGRLLVIWRIMEELSGALTVFNKNRDRSLTELMLSVCEELSRYCVTASMLSHAAESTADLKLKDKLNDIALIYAAYSAQMKEMYSDSSDDVNRLADIYAKEKPREDDVFFLDSFNGFTAPEIRVLDTLIKHSSVTVTLNKYRENGKVGFFTVEKTEKILLDICKKHSVSCNIIAQLSEDNKYTAIDFKLIRDRLFDNSYQKNKDDTLESENIAFAVCKDRFYQAEYIAIQISKLIRSGARYKDIALVTRGTEKYESILSSVFKKYEIPLFLSKRSPLSKTSLFQTVYSALSVISGGYQTEDVLTYVKTGLLGFTFEEIDLLESYTALWNISGKRWTEEQEWITNPLGFTDRTDARAATVLEKINDIRKGIVTPLCELSSEIKGSNITDICKTLYTFMIKSGITEYFQKTDRKEDITVYNSFIKLLETISKTVGDIPANAKLFASLLYMVAKNTDYGMIPSSFDCVTAGDASILRCNGKKYIFLTDCEAGVFPASAADDSFFSDREKKHLLDRGIELSPDISEKNDLEAFYFLKNAAAPSKKLFATYCLKNGKKYPSAAFLRLCALFPKNEPINYPSDCPVTERLQTLGTSKEIYAALKGTDYADELEKLYAELGKNTVLSDTAISEHSFAIPRETADRLFGNKINMTYSRMESYAKCPFNFYCTYILGLKSKKYNFFMASDKGTYIHRILETAIKDLFAVHKADQITPQIIQSTVDTSVTEFLINTVGNDMSAEQKRFISLVSRSKKALIPVIQNIVNEFKNSDFKPEFFEFSISRGEDSPSPLKFTLNDNTPISIYGTIDRVDTYRKDGNVYVRVVDYKSGSAEHNINNIKYGVDAQMLLYLFSICKSQNPAFLSRLNVSDGNIAIPAGVLYQSAKTTVSSKDGKVPYELGMKALNDGLKRSGVLLHDRDILNAMEHGLKGEFIPVTEKDSNIKSTKKVTLAAAEDFDNLYDTVEKAVTDIGEKMKLGNADASPLKVGSIDACKYCKYAPICRSKNPQDV